jgi:hypothetical protein
LNPVRRDRRAAVIVRASELLPALENIPKTQDQWNRWSFDHRDSHNRIRAAILKQNGINLTDYQIDPIDPNNTTQFLQNNASLHGDMNSVLKLQSSDLEDVNFGSEPELEAWIRIHYQEHQYAELKLQV